MDNMAKWRASDIPSQAGRLAVVTGTGGLGFETALELGRAKAKVILAGRNPAKGADSVARIQAAVPDANIRFAVLDLASLASVAAFSDTLLAEHGSLDILVNNAGVMAPAKRQVTADGFELQFGTNYLGHYALTGRLLPLLRKGSKPRVVSLSSIAHRNGQIHFDDLQWAKTYKPWPAYSQSKLAMLMFALEFQRRSDAAGWGVMSIAAHPGVAQTELIANGTGKLAARLSAMFFFPIFGQSAAAGTLSQLYAATSPDAKGGTYYGPDGFMEMKGAVKIAEIKPQALDRAAAARLWDESARLTGVTFGDALAPAPAGA
jgi:NAD(P)-dependent dehydrogenase (short-subunit alcohol dehydrogenase family)